MFPRSIEEADALLDMIQNMRDSGEVIYPPQHQIFRALELVSPTQVRVVIIGQDPYHGRGQANGLSFSVNPQVDIPLSLANIFNEMCRDCRCNYPSSGDLTSWAEQGVLLLNSVLTVKAGNADSHSKLGWQCVTSEILNVCMEQDQAIVFVGWGSHAIKLLQRLDYEDKEGKFFLYSSHPSPLGAMRYCGQYPPFYGSQPFSRINQILRENGQLPIKWELT